MRTFIEIKLSRKILCYKSFSDKTSSLPFFEPTENSSCSSILNFAEKDPCCPPSSLLLSSLRIDLRYFFKSVFFVIRYNDLHISCRDSRSTFLRCKFFTFIMLIYQKRLKRKTLALTFWETVVFHVWRLTTDWYLKRKSPFIHDLSNIELQAIW